MRSLTLVTVLLAAGCADEADLALERSAAPPPYAPQATIEDDDSGSADDDSDTASSGGEDGRYEPAAVVGLEPAPDSDDHHYRDPLIIDFGAYAYGGSVALSEVGAYPIALDGIWEADYTRLVAWPVEPLSPLTTYRVTVEAGSGAQSYEFRTSAIGSPVPDPTALDGRSFALEFTGARSFAPAGLASWLRAVAPGRAVLFGLSNVPQDALTDTDGDAASLGAQASVGVGSTGAWQAETCGSSWAADAGALLWANPYFVRPTGPLTLQAGSLQLDFVEARLEGDVAPEGDRLHNVGLSGWLVADSLAAAYGSAVCDGLASTLGATCEACPAEAGLEPDVACVRVEIDHLDGGLTDASPVALDEALCPEGATDFASCSAARSSLALTPAALLLLPALRRRRNRLSAD